MMSKNKSLNSGFVEAHEDPAAEDAISRTPTSNDCAFNWDDTHFSEKKEKRLPALSQECTQKSKRSIAIKHFPDLRNFLIKDHIWGLARIHSIEKWSPYELQTIPSAFPLPGEQEPDVNEFKSEKDHLEFKIDVKAGFGVDVYILDTGINISHEEFGGRARLGKNFVEKEPDDDLNGHGTHVAGIIGSFSYGVAKEVTLISVKCLNKNKQGQRKDIISAIEWALASSKLQSRPSIIHLSVIVSPDEKIDSAVEAAAQLGVPVIVSGSNDFQDACKFSPARSKHALTVSGINSKDQHPENIAQGDCVDLFAPGMHILSTYIGSNVSKAYMSGTSMAAPYVTGIAASVLSRGFDMGYCMLPHFDPSSKSGACTSRLYDYLKQSADHVVGLRIARIPKVLIVE